MAETYQVDVALVGGGAAPDFDEDCARPYSDRPKVVVTAERSESLAAVLREATIRFEVTHPGDYTDAGRSLAFFRGDPSEIVVPTIPTTKTVTITNSAGLAVWHVEPEDASMDELAVAHQRMVFSGDPLRPYLLVDPKWQMGGQTPGGWDTFLGIWNVLLVARGSWEVLQGLVRVSQSTLDLLNRAAERWQRHRLAALHARAFFESRSADIIDVIETAQAAMTYQLEDLMAWTGIEDPAIAADIAGWAGYELDPGRRSLSKSPDEELRTLVSGFPIELSVDDLPPQVEEAHRAVMDALATYLLDQGHAREF